MKKKNSPQFLQNFENGVVRSITSRASNNFFNFIILFFSSSAFLRFLRSHERGTNLKQFVSFATKEQPSKTFLFQAKKSGFRSEEFHFFHLIRLQWGAISVDGSTSPGKKARPFLSKQKNSDQNKTI